MIWNEICARLSPTLAAKTKTRRGWGTQYLWAGAITQFDAQAANVFVYRDLSAEGAPLALGVSGMPEFRGAAGQGRRLWRYTRWHD